MKPKFRIVRNFSLAFLLSINSFQTASAQESIAAIQQAMINKLKQENEQLKSSVVGLQGQIQGTKFRTLYLCPNPCVPNWAGIISSYVTTSSTCEYDNDGRESMACTAIGQFAVK